MKSQDENQTKNMQFTETIAKIERWVRQPKVYFWDLEKERKVYEVQQKMQEILDEENITAKVEIKPCPLGMGDAVIEFECDSFIVRNIAKFQNVINEMSNFEIYATAKGIKFAGIIPNIAKIVYGEEI